MHMYLHALRLADATKFKFKLASKVPGATVYLSKQIGEGLTLLHMHVCCAIIECYVVKQLWQPWHCCSCCSQVSGFTSRHCLRFAAFGFNPLSSCPKSRCNLQTGNTTAAVTDGLSGVPLFDLFSKMGVAMGLGTNQLLNFDVSKIKKVGACVRHAATVHQHSKPLQSWHRMHDA